jgi:4-oxalocrotonate tautomerase
MPLINVKLIEDVFTPEQKQQIVETLTDAMVSIEGENMRSVTWVVVEEVKSGDWGIGGKVLTTDAVRSPRDRFARRIARPALPVPC